MTQQIWYKITAVGKQRYTPITCAACGNTTHKRNAHINRSRRKKSRMFCNVRCAHGVISVEQTKPSAKRRCENCRKTFVGKNLARSPTCCSTHCARSLGAKHQAKTEYNAYLTQWKSGRVSGLRSSTGDISLHIRRYLFEKFHNQCARCGWNKVNPTTNKIPLAVEHINGDWRDNREQNLTLLCPNCHALTPTYGSLNSGRGRPRRGAG